MEAAWLSFVAWTVRFKLPDPETFSHNSEAMSNLLAAYLEFAYGSGKPFSNGKMAVLVVQDRYRHLRKSLQAAWDTLTTWELDVPLVMHTPLLKN